MPKQTQHFTVKVTYDADRGDVFDAEAIGDQLYHDWTGEDLDGGATLSLVFCEEQPRPTPNVAQIEQMCDAYIAPAMDSDGPTVHHAVVQALHWAAGRIGADLFHANIARLYWRTEGAA